MPDDSMNRCTEFVFHNLICKFYVLPDYAYDLELGISLWMWLEVER